MKAVLRTITPQTPNVSTLRFDVSISFKPGQSIAVTFPGDFKKRYYSISSSPTEGAYIEITVKMEAGSELASTVGKLKRGDAIDIEGPIGDSLILPDTVTEPLVFIAAGTGATPCRSMIGFLINQAVSGEFWLLHSVRSQADLLFQKDFTEWSGKDSRFHYIPTITKDFDNTWKNETGRIGEALIRKHVPTHPSLYFLCGPGGFVTDMEKLLRETLNIPADHIRREKW